MPRTAREGSVGEDPASKVLAKLGFNILRKRRAVCLACIREERLEMLAHEGVQHRLGRTARPIRGRERGQRGIAGSAPHATARSCRFNTLGPGSLAWARSSRLRGAVGACLAWRTDGAVAAQPVKEEATSEWTQYDKHDLQQFIVFFM
jgi:hypothetical protein